MRPIFRNILIGIGVVFLLVAGALVWAARHLDSYARDYAERALEQKFKSDVELGEIRLSLVTGVHATIGRLKLYYRSRHDIPPFIEVEKAEIRANYLAIIANPKVIDSVKLTGLRINIPPKEEGQKRFPSSGKGGKPVPGFVINRVVADGSILRILPKDPDNDPLEWDMKKLTLKSAGPREAMHFDTVLTNAKPPGDIVSQGRFGPWNSDDLGQTPVNGTYTFKNADLSVFNGIAGILSSEGNYHGILERIDTEGHTETPDFRLGEGANKVPLKTDFHATVDGTNGNTYLQLIEAVLGSTPLRLRGAVAGKPKVKGKTIDLDIDTTGGRIDDFLRLAVKSRKPPLTGAILLQAKMLIPPGDVDVVRKIRLRGAFNMDKVRFTSTEIQEKLTNMSQMAQGRPGEQLEQPAMSRFEGNFAVAGGTIDMDRLVFAIPGARVSLAGKYGMRNEELDFTGKLRMQAKISETQKGVKRWLLKPVDPFFAKNGAGAEIPIKITGTRESPQFGANFRARKK